MQDTLEEAYFYAGGSIRSIQLSVRDITNFLDRKITVCNDMAQLIGSRGVGDASKSAINSLMSIYNGHSVVVSKYVTRALITNVSDALVNSARNMIPDNPAWQGWVSEFQFISNVYKRKSLYLKNEDGTFETWSRDDYNISKPNLILDGSKLEKNGSWYIPPKWNQECFDAIQRVSDYEIRAVQITNSESHTCKLQYLVPILQCLDVHVVDFVYACGYKNFESFSVKNPSTSQSEAKIAIEEKRQFSELMLVMEDIRNMKRNRSDQVNTLIPDADIKFRKICYQDKFGNMLTKE